MGFALPPGTVVGTQAWTMHRNPAVFPSPDTFLPDRWLCSDEPRSAESLIAMHQHFMPFGTGSRVCGGQNVAMSMLKIVVATVARNFNIVAPPETNEKSMEIKESFVSTSLPFALILQRTVSRSFSPLLGYAAYHSTLELKFSRC